MNLLNTSPQKPQVVYLHTPVGGGEADGAAEGGSQ